MAASQAKPTTNKKTDIKAVIAMSQGGLRVTEIAERTGCTHSNISQILKRYKIKQNELDTFKTHRAEVFAGIQDKVLSSITPQAIKNASIRDKAILFGTIYDKERLERGQSTSNHAHLHKMSEDTAEMLGRITGESAETVIEESK